MMQILTAGGISPLTDGQRPADPSNPLGYFEYQPVKRLAADNSWLGEARGRAVKVVIPLIPFLPSGFEYQIVVMHRDLGEILDSQERMLERLGVPVRAGREGLRAAFERQFAAGMDFAARHPRTTVLTVGHRHLLESPDQAIDSLLGFLDREDLDREAMAKSVVPELYRQRPGPGKN